MAPKFTSNMSHLNFKAFVGKQMMLTLSAGTKLAGRLKQFFVGWLVLEQKASDGTALKRYVSVYQIVEFVVID